MALDPFSALLGAVGLFVVTMHYVGVYLLGDRRTPSEQAVRQDVDQSNGN